MHLTLPETNSSHLPGSSSQKETIVFQPSMFRCELLVSGRVFPTFYSVFFHFCLRQFQAFLVWDVQSFPELLPMSPR